MFYFVFVNEMLVHIYKITTGAVELKSYSEIKDTNSIKIWLCDLGREGDYGVKLGIFLHGCTVHQ
jgi:hypothetical protein